MNCLHMEFWSAGSRRFEEPQLVAFTIRDSSSGQCRQLTRGRYPTDEGHGAFVYSSAVHAFALLAARHAASFDDDSIGKLSGGQGSPALALEYAILKKPLWIWDTFGMSRGGSSNVYRYFRRTNAGMKRPGPVSVCMNPNALPRQALSFSVDGAEVVTPATLAAELERSWFKRYGPETPAVTDVVPHAGSEFSLAS